MTQGFDEWFKGEDPFFGNDENMDCIWAKKFMKVAFSAGEASRQAEIDDLKRELEILQGMHNAVSLTAGELIDERDKLQKRVDFLEKGLSSVIRESGYIDYREIRGLCRSLLKGESNE